MIKALSKLDVITLFVEDLPESKAFYTEVFGLEVIYEDDASAVVQMSNLIINLLRVSNAATLVEPIPVATPGGSRALLTIEVDDANAVCAELAAHGVTLLNGPIDRPWGRRTAAFADPAGNTWEIAQVLSELNIRKCLVLGLALSVVKQLLSAYERLACVAPRSGDRTCPERPSVRADQGYPTDPGAPGPR